MPLTETPPDSVQDTLRSLAPDSHDLPLPETRISLAGDIAPDGTFGERWLVVDRTHLRVLTLTGGHAHLDLELPLAQIKEARTDTLVGNGALSLITKDGRTLEALRYTVALAPAFGAAARALESYLKEEEPPESLGQDLHKKVCPKCGDPLPDDTNVCAKCVDKKAVLARLLSYALPYKFRALLVILLMLSGTATGLVQPKFQQHLIDDVLIPHRHVSWIALILLSLIGINLLNVGIGIWRGRVVAWMSNHMVYTIRGQAYDRLQALSLGYYEKRQVGSLMSRVTQDVGELQDFLVQGITFFVVNTLTIIGIMVILLVDNWRLTLLVLIPIPITILATRAIWKAMRQRFHRMWHLRSSLSASINAALSGVKVVKAFAQESREMQRFQDKSYGLFAAGVGVQQAWQTYFPLLGFVTTLGTFIIWYYGGLEVFHNTSNNPHLGMTLGTLTMFLSYIGMLMGPLQQMTQIADWLSRSTAAAERVFEVIDAEPDVQDEADAVSMPHIQGRVELKNVRFSYDKNQSVLDDVSIVVEPGEMIGLVGHSGAGKSTIINLLSRFYDVKDGQILVDGVDIRHIKMHDLRSQVGVVLQEPFLFPGTISDNIAYAKPDATPIEVMRAAKAANAHDFIMRFPDGYDTWVGERGARLSGGERQRISIARAILHDPRILILDEATASVDTETEKQIQEAIGRLIQGRTTFAIAHRLSTLRNASRLMVMERGKLVELGTHEELLANPEGVFRKLVDMQQEVNKLKVV
ncbi:MAG: ATP-binding cassette domain-containing protein [Armatimonadetes bacterium]|nr:ATP-binding cassette domain-containing protein [Armatimonadota bacterium]